jgi:hypothetical protein
MRVFKDFRLMLNGLPLDEWLRRSAPHLSGSWRRSVDLESQARDFGIGDGPYLCYELHDDPANSPVILVLSGRKGDDHLDVINIVSSQKSELSQDEYNSLLERFATEVITPSIAGTPAEMRVSQGVVTLDDLMPAGVADLLRRFSRQANKSTGTAHPMDQERWFAFVAAAHRSGRAVGVDVLGRWLVEHGGWSSERAHDLAIEYEQAIAMLEYYDRHAR